MTIQQKSSGHTQEAVVFFDGEEIGKEMLYTEFEALLDCVVPIRDFAGHDLQAAYVRLDTRLAPVTVVLFVIPFDENGFPDERWNVPLRQLADRGVRGPDLGGGPVRLVTRSQCPIAGHEGKLWDIRFGPGGNTLSQLQERLVLNRLGIDAPDLDHPSPGPASTDATAWNQAPAPARQPTAQAQGGESPDAMFAMMQHSGQQLASVREQHQRDMMGLQQQVAALQQQLQAQENEKLLLLEQIGQQEQALADATTEIERRTRQLGAQMRKQIEAARQEVEAARDAALAERDRQMQDELQRLERERQMQEDMLQSLRTEITELRRDKLRLMGEGADKFFAALKEKGVKFVAFQPGAGHLTIPMEDLARYLEETEKFVAEKCGVGLEHYRRWLAHYTNPVCQGSAGDGGRCAKALTRLLKPAEFVAGMHDRCDIHKQLPRQPLDQGRSA